MPEAARVSASPQLEEVRSRTAIGGMPLAGSSAAGGEPIIIRSRDEQLDYWRLASEISPNMVIGAGSTTLTTTSEAAFGAGFNIESSTSATMFSSENGDETMADHTREEITAKIEASEARMETRLVSIEGKLDRLFDRVDVSVKASERAESAAEKAEGRAGEAQRAASNTKWNILATGLVIIGILFAAWAIWAQGIEMVGTLLSTPKP